MNLFNELKHLPKLSLVKQWIKVDYGKDKAEDELIKQLVLNAHFYVEDACGNYVISDKAITKANLFILYLVATWYETRDLSGTVSKYSDTQMTTVSSLAKQLRYEIEGAKDESG